MLLLPPHRVISCLPCPCPGGRGGGGRGGSKVRTGARPAPTSLTGAQGSSKYPGHIMRLNKALATHGVASRRSSEELIAEGKVKVNGEPCTNPAQLVNTRKDKLFVEGKGPIELGDQEMFYFAVNKPKGYICSNKASLEHESAGRLAIDLLEPYLVRWAKKTGNENKRPPRLFTVGRLDVNSSGLIFVTNDGEWAQHVSHPSSGLNKEYIVTLERPPNRKEIDTIASGGVVDGTFVQPVAVGLAVDPNQTNPSPQMLQRIRVIVNEGRNREVRTLVAFAGLEVRNLKRIRVGGYRLPPDLKVGDIRALKPWEIRRVSNLGQQKQYMTEVGVEPE